VHLLTETFLETPMSAALTVDYQTHPEHYKHIQLSFEGEIATLGIKIDEDAGLRPG